MNLIPAHDEILAQYESIRDRVVGKEYFIADSDRVVLKLFSTSLEIVSMLATEGWYLEHAEKIAAFSGPRYVATIETLSAIVGFPVHQGVMARVKRPVDRPLEELCDAPIIVMDGLAKSENVGAVLRNAAAFGIRHVLVDHRTCHPYQRRAVRTSMGNVYGMKIHQTPDLPGALRTLKTFGVRIIGFENRKQAVDLPEFRVPHKWALIIGSEAEGMAQNVLQEVQDLVKIPIDPEVYALNAACASAIGLYGLTKSSPQGTFKV